MPSIDLKNTPTIESPLSTAFVIRSIASVRAMNADLPFLKPNCNSQISLCLSRNDISRSYIKRSKTFDIQGNIETGRSFWNSSLFICLNIGTTFASFSSFGNTPLMNDRLHICTNGVAIHLSNFPYYTRF